MAKPAEKQVARRNDVVQAALRVIARNGLENASFRAIAAELGCTVGVLTHYFPNREALMDLVLETVSDSIQISFAAHPKIRTVREFEALIAELLPLDPQSRALWRIWLSFAVAANGVPALVQKHAERYTQMIGDIAKLLARLRDDGLLAPDLDAESEAEALVCLVDGVGVHGALMPNRMTPARQRAIVKGFIDGLSAPVRPSTGG